jgi:hypothetical protein
VRHGMQDAAAVNVEQVSATLIATTDPTVSSKAKMASEKSLRSSGSLLRSLRPASRVTLTKQPRLCCLQGPAKS